MTTEHILKVHSEVWYDLAYGNKTFEYRKNDRDFKVGDILILKNYDAEKQQFIEKTEFDTCNELRRAVLYILHGGSYGVPEGYCIMAIGKTMW